MPTLAMAVVRCMMNEFDENYTAYQSERSGIRRFVRRWYLHSAASQLHGPTLDFGCGTGELLARLPKGSKGVEYNQASVEYCRAKGLDVSWYDGSADDWSLSTLSADSRFDSMVISHVLEHLDGPMNVLRRLLDAAGIRGVKRALVIVPGQAGFRIDSTHKTFVQWEMLRDAILSIEGWSVARKRYYPGDIRAIGQVFPHHELQVLIEKR
jgi:SAM-dependent methyltransferase